MEQIKTNIILKRIVIGFRIRRQNFQPLSWVLMLLDAKTTQKDMHPVGFEPTQPYDYCNLSAAP
jgi:hypothetical protein